MLVCCLVVAATLCEYTANQDEQGRARTSFLLYGRQENSLCKVNAVCYSDPLLINWTMWHHATFDMYATRIYFLSYKVDFLFHPVALMFWDLVLKLFQWKKLQKCYNAYQSSPMDVGGGGGGGVCVCVCVCVCVWVYSSFVSISPSILVYMSATASL